MQLARLLTPFLLLPILTLAATLQLNIAPNQFLANPASLPSTTHATLAGPGRSLRAALSRSNSLTFTTVPAGSYLLTVDARDVYFPALRVDVDDSGVQVFQTFWGNEWGNKGELRASGGDSVKVDVFADRAREYYTVRAGFSPLQFLKNPMILMALFSLVMIVGLPYLMNNMDEETRAEFEEMQSKSPVAQATSGNGPAGLQNFDFAAWMAGRSTSK